MTSESAHEPELDCRFAGSALLVFAHADDEAIALGARLHRLQTARLIHVTDGAPRDEQDSRAHGFATLGEYREARVAELHAMLAAAGVAEVRCENFGYADQQAALHLPELTRRIAEVIEAERPHIVFTHPYEGGHPDHDACAFGVHHAVRLVSGRAPRIVECAFYHAGPQGIETGCFLPFDEAGKARICRLAAEEQERKRRLLACFTTQQETLQYFPTDQESFRVAPPYDFGQPPHAGRLFYENYPWGMSGARFCELAGAAADALGVRAGEAAARCR